MLRNMRHPKGYGMSAADGARSSADDTYAEQLYRHYAGIPGWCARDRHVLAKQDRPHPQAGADPSTRPRLDEDGLERANARAAAHEEAQVRAADDAVIRDAREGRMP